MPDYTSGFYSSFDSFLGGLLPGGAPLGTLPGGGAVPFSPAASLQSGQTAVPGGMQIIAQPQQVTALRAPKGYVIVTDSTGRKVAMLAKVAYALGLRKRPSRGGGITAREIASARRVQSVIQSLTTARKPKMPLKKGRR